MRRTFALCVRARNLATANGVPSPEVSPLFTAAMSRTKRRWRHYSMATKVEGNSSSGTQSDPTVLHVNVAQNKNVQNRGAQHTDNIKASKRLASMDPNQPGSDQSNTQGCGQPPKSSASNGNDNVPANVRHAPETATSVAGKGFHLERAPTSNRRRGVKRKAVDQPQHRPELQRAKTVDGPVQDVEYVRANYEIPKSQQYPAVNKELFKIDSMKDMMDKTRHGILQLKSEYILAEYPPGQSAWRCRLRYKLPGSKVTHVIGTGTNKRDSHNAAYLQVLARLHTAGRVLELFPDPPKLDEPAKQKLDTPNPEMIKTEKDAKLDVYNYAARFNAIPVYSARASKRGGRASAVDITIELPEQGLKTTARGVKLQHADLMACVKFKQEAEKYHAKHGDAALMIKDASALNTDNIKNFYTFHRNQNPRTNVETVIQPASALGIKGRGEWFSGQTTIDGKSYAEPVYSAIKEHTDRLAQLVAAVGLSQENPELLERFQQAISASVTGTILVPVKPIDAILDEESRNTMQKTLSKVEKMGLPRLSDELAAHEQFQRDARRNLRERLDEAQLDSKSTLLQAKLKAYESNQDLKATRDLRSTLPMTQYRDQVLKLVQNHEHCIVMGATGSGKTTQVPQILLEDAIARGQGGRCDIICTQPRKIAATSVARRVAEERGENLQETVGYHVRFDARNARLGGSINYCTTGILLQQLQHMPDEILDTASHIIIDEVHERDINIDFLMILIKKTIDARRLAGKPTPKVILMSATIDEQLFAKYFEGRTKEGKILPCPSISVPGRTFPVKEFYLETILEELDTKYKFARSLNSRTDGDTLDYIQSERSFRISAPSQTDSGDEGVEATIDWKRQASSGEGGSGNDKEDALIPVALIGTTIAHIAKTTKDGAFLVFLPGFEEIKNVRQYLQEVSPLGVDFNDETRFKLFTLHSSVPAVEQKAALDPVPRGCRKIILSTNIAETSVTIPDIQYVVDTGKLREKRYDQTSRITMLASTWVAKSNAKQRAGRAGRVQNGNYYAIYSKERFNSLRNIGLPEMLRSDLQEICLDIKAQSFDTPIRDFLAQSIEPPAPAAVEQSVHSLITLQALSENEDLTSLGRVLAALPVHPSLGKMILLGVIFRCLDPMIILGAALAERAPFVRPPEKRKEAISKQRRFLEGTKSDHVAIVNAIREARMVGYTRGPNAAHMFRDEYFMHHGSFKSIVNTAEQIEEILVEAGIIPYTPARDKFEGELGHPKLNKNANDVNLIRALILAGTHPNIAVNLFGGMTFRSAGEPNALIHPGSLNYGIASRGRDSESAVKDTVWAFTTLQKSNDGRSMFMSDSTQVTPLMAMLFGGRITKETTTVTMDGWLPFWVKSEARWSYAPSENVKLVVKFRQVLDRILSTAYASIKPKSRNPGSDLLSHPYLADDPVREAFAAGITELLNSESGVKSSGGGGTRHLNLR